MTRFITQIIETHRLAFIFAIAAFPLICLPIFFEGLQHIAEVKLGMFAEQSVRSFGDAEQNKRLVFGVFKVLSIVATAIFLPRFFLHERDLKRTLKFSRAALKSVLIGFIISAIAVLWIFIIGPSVIGLLVQDASEKLKFILPMLVLVVLAFPLQNRMNKGMARVFDDAPLSETQNRAINKAMMGGFAPMMVLAIAPAMWLHFALNMKATGQSMPVLWGLLSLDSLVVGLLAALMGAAIYIIYRDARNAG